MIRGSLWYALCIASSKTKDMNDIDFVRMTAMLVLPTCIKKDSDPVKAAVDYAEELLKECEKRECDM